MIHRNDKRTGIEDGAGSKDHSDAVALNEPGRTGGVVETEAQPVSVERRRLVALRTDVSDQNRAMMTAARLVHSSNRIRNFAAVLLFLMVCSVIGLAWLPWQQSARGTGRVIAYKPGERQQEITSPQKGVVKYVPDYLAEGAFVEKGDLLLEIEPFAANLEMQLEGEQINLEAKLETARMKAEAYGENVRAYEDAREAAIAAAEQAINSAKAELAAKQEMLVGYEVEAERADINYRRQARLEDRGLTSPKELEYTQSKQAETAAKVAAAKRDVEAAEAKVSEKQSELEQKQNEAQAKVDKAKAEQQAALGEMATVQKEILSLGGKRSELDRLEIRAPLDGYIQRLPAFQGAQTVKEGDYLLTFVPRTDDHSVELLVRGNDMPLIHTGDHVRLQFEGWPALQFSGWPSVAVGTFGGEVALVDPSDDGTGRFRVMIRPAPGETWPNEAYLRQGVRANGWIMLGRVSLAYEIWRQLNGFPPVLPDGQKLQDGKDAPKRPKLPK